jgi:hypothetical protein
MLHASSFQALAGFVTSDVDWDGGVGGAAR